MGGVFHNHSLCIQYARTRLGDVKSQVFLDAHGAHAAPWLEHAVCHKGLSQAAVAAFGVRYTQELLTPAVWSQLSYQMQQDAGDCLNDGGQQGLAVGLHCIGRGPIRLQQCSVEHASNVGGLQF